MRYSPPDAVCPVRVYKSAIGQTVHLAARMEQLAIPGSIVLTPATVRLVEGLVRLNTLGPVPVKGLAEAVEVFQLVGATAVRRRLQAGAARGLTRFVGRETEIAALAQALAWAGAGHGQVDQSRLAYVSSYRADYLRLSGSYDRALVAGQRALTLVVALGDIRLQAMTNEHLGVIYYSLGSYQRAMDCFRQSMASLESELLRERFGMAVPDAIESRTRLLLCLAGVGAFAEGVILGEEGIGLAEAINHPISLARACYGVGFVSLCKGDLHQAIARLERGLALCQTWSIRDWFLVLAAALGDAYALCGRLAEALPLLEQTVEQDAMRRRHLSSLWIAWLSEGYMLAGRLANAMPLARQALDLARDGRERGCEAWALRLLGEIHSHQDSLDADQAAVHYRQALALAEALGMCPLQAHCHRGLGTLYTKIDQREQARAELSAAIALYRPLDMSFGLPQGEAALAQVEGR
jgi:tetratricopeptide (TPR) repeat protein